MAKKELWFRRKIYGLGWFPITWQGWAVVLGFAGIITINAFLLGKSNEFLLIIETFILAMILIFICYKKGEKLKWKWGK